MIETARNYMRHIRLHMYTRVHMDTHGYTDMGRLRVIIHMYTYVYTCKIYLQYDVIL